MASRTCGTLNKAALLSIILWSGIFVTSFGVGIALSVIVNPGILLIFVVLGLSLSTIAVGSVKRKMKARHDVKPQRLSSSPGLRVTKLRSNAPSYAEEKITIYPSSSTATNASDPCLCIEPKANAMRSYSGSRIYSSDEWAGPTTYVARGSAAQLLPGPMNLLLVPIRPSLPDLETSSDNSATCECETSLSYHGPYSWYERRKGYTIYDLNSGESYNTSAGFVTLDTTEVLYEANLVRTPSKPEKIANRSSEPKTVSWDMNTTGRTRPADEVRKGDNEVRSDTSSVVDENAVKPQARLQETPVVATKADVNDKLDIAKKASSDIGQESAWVSLSTPTRRSGVPPGDETSGTTNEQRLSLVHDQPLEDSIQQELTMHFNGLNHSKPRRSKSAAFSTGDKDHRDRRSHGSSKSAHSVKDSASQTSLTASRGGDKGEFSMLPLVKAEVVKVAVINNPLSEGSSQQSSTGPTEPREVTSCSEHLQATAKMRNRAVQSKERQASPEIPKKKSLTGRPSVFLRPCEMKQGTASYYREQRSK